MLGRVNGLKACVLENPYVSQTGETEPQGQGCCLGEMSSIDFILQTDASSHAIKAALPPPAALKSKKHDAAYTSPSKRTLAACQAKYS
jgi:hypothetical protein